LFNSCYFGDLWAIDGGYFENPVQFCASAYQAEAERIARLHRALWPCDLGTPFSNLTHEVAGPRDRAQRRRPSGTLSPIPSLGEGEEEVACFVLLMPPDDDRRCLSAFATSSTNRTRLRNCSGRRCTRAMTTRAACRCRQW